MHSFSFPDTNVDNSISHDIHLRLMLLRLPAKHVAGSLANDFPIEMTLDVVVNVSMLI